MSPRRDITEDLLWIIVVVILCCTVLCMFVNEAGRNEYSEQNWSAK